MSSIIKLQSGQDLTPDLYNSDNKGIPYITGASNIENGNIIINRWTEHGKAFAYNKNVLLTCKGTVGTIAICNIEKVHIARQIMAIDLSSTIDTDYFILVLNTLINELKSKAKSMIPGISRDDVLNSLIPLPPFEEQKRIVSRTNKLLPLLK